MSNSALRWARASRGLTPAQKFVLLVLADAAREPSKDGAGREDDYTCWIAAAAIAEETGLSDRGVRDALHDLIEAGAIRGVMSRGVHPRWTLVVENKGTTFAKKRNGVPVQKRSHRPANRPLPSTEDRNPVPDEDRNLVPNQNRNSIPFEPEPDSVKSEPRSLRSEPGSHKPSRTLTEPSSNPKAREARAAVVVDLPAWLSPEHWDAWCRHRRGKHWTQEAAVLSIRELGKHREDGHDPADVIAHSIASGYRGLFAPNRRAAAAGSGASGLNQSRYRNKQATPASAFTAMREMAEASSPAGGGERPRHEIDGDFEAR
ncbi:hypothetical protein HB662_19800 [Roseomonas frigidaquae]|uniref:Helix-turn-helix domain-containing protein n=1 Tax=Falsiroseomonas frigidaquae TaxID=487318 RepID=A0ABX1F3V7_9PROT|nr:helix-turn-helix domain-containing protein [Falsiroseomonas frigidaquae]NKE47034.1 hypothetical protein [Falsiroseomonas frigidaquae]